MTGAIKPGNDGLHSPGLDAKAAAAAKAILESVLEGYHSPVAVSLWNGEIIIGDKASSCRVIFRHPGPLRHLVLRRDPVLHLAEAYMAGEVDIEGNIETLFTLVEYLQEHMPSWPARLRAGWQALRLLAGKNTHIHRAKREERHNSRASIAHHYDVSNAFFRLWLDPEMVYSCAYFRDAGQSLTDAQRDKLDYICRKLRLTPEQTLLEIGCGWGALVCWAARHYGVRAHGITLSEQQYDYAIDYIHKAGLEDRVTVELRDYRDLSHDVHYDREVIAAMEGAGFEILDVEGLRRHYVLTLRRWMQALEKHREDAVRVVDEATYRLWRLYMAGSAYFFEQGSNGVFQVLTGHVRQPLSTPLRRNDLYNTFAASKRRSPGT